MKRTLSTTQLGVCTTRADARHVAHRVSVLPKASAVHQVSTLNSNDANGRCSTVALKEWNVAIGALREGLQTILLRKGGIREPVFKPPGKEFLLFPTSFHSEENLLKPGIAEKFQEEMALEPRKEASLQLPVYVSVTGAWITEDPAVLAALSDLHIWTPAFVDARLKWRGKQPLTVLELKAWKLQPPATLQVKEEFFGCFSFVDVASGLQQPPSLHNAQPVIPEAEFKARQQLLRERLASIQCSELQL